MTAARPSQQRTLSAPGRVSSSHSLLAMQEQQQEQQPKPHDENDDETCSLRASSWHDRQQQQQGSSHNSSFTKTFSADLDQHILRGLTLAGVAVCCLNTLYGLFHVDVFLRAYHLPYATYSFGRILFSVWSTASTLWASKWLDSQVATTGLDRCDLVGCLGVLLAITFVLPFGRFWKSATAMDTTVDDDDEYQMRSEALWMFWQALDGAHFVVSMTLYDTVSTIMMISLASAVSDDHNMTDQERVENMSSSQAYNLVASMIVATLGLNLFDVTAPSFYHFQFYVVVLALVAVLVFGTAQSIISGDYLHLATRNKKHVLWHIWKGWTVSLPKQVRTGHKRTTHKSTFAARPSAVNWRQALRDLWNHNNFMRWIFLECLLEMQTHFVSTFVKTFVDELLVDIPHFISDWSLSLLRPLQQVMTIVVYVPIRWYGYPRVYTIMIGLLWIMATVTLIVATPASTTWILCFLVIYGVGAEALRAAGFFMVMSDLVLELKQSHATQGRFNEPSLAGLLLGASTLICKPLQSLLPILAATLLDWYPDNPRQVLYYLLVLPPFICSILQLWVWRKYDLHPQRTHELRVELHEFHFYQSQQHDQHPLNGNNHNNKNPPRSQEHSEWVPSPHGGDGKGYTPKRRGPQHPAATSGFPFRSNDVTTMDSGTSTTGRLSGVI